MLQKIGISTKNIHQSPRCGRRAALQSLSLASLGAGAAMLGSSPIAFAQTGVWPSKAVRMVVPTGPGSSLDLIARALQERLRERLGQPVIIDNKPGAGGLLGTDLVAKANDGHTFGISFNGPLAYAPHLFQKMPYRLPEDLAAIAITSSQPNVLAVNAALPVRSVSELLDLLRAKPGQLNFASIGNGSSSHLSMELLKFLSKTYAVHLPFNGSPPSAMAVANNDAQMIMTVAPAVLPHVQAGRMRIIAVTSRQRYAPLPDVPTVAESGVRELKEFEAIAWNGIVGPASTPTQVIQKLNAEINAALRDAGIAQKLSAAGMTPLTGSPADLSKLMAEEMRKWGPIIKRTGASLG
jgi:tripartite-type tricarboxylate transporter receptor subunit TctC